MHPVIATRWAGSLKSKKLEVVMCANDGYLPGMTHFSCRVAKCAKERMAGSTSAKTGLKRKVDDCEQESGEKEVNIIAVLNEYASRESGLREAMGDNFARGHKQVCRYLSSILRVIDSHARR